MNDADVWDEWEHFTSSGLIQDYLAYATHCGAVQAQRMGDIKNNADRDNRHCPQRESSGQ